jgi:lambda repressor-like predicted transcriptional regulator
LLRKLGLVVTRSVFVSGLEKRSQSLPIAGVRGALAAMAVLAFTLGAPANLAAETMESALARAYQRNPQLIAQRAIARQSEEGVPQALSGYRPTFSATAAIGEQYTNEAGIFPTVPRCLMCSMPSRHW